GHGKPEDRCLTRAGRCHRLIGARRCAAPIATPPAATRRPEEADSAIMLTLLLPPSRGHQDALLHARHVAGFLTERLSQPVQVEVAADYAELEYRLLKGEVELAWAPPVLCARAEPTARGILSSIRIGRSSYRSALVARADRHLSLKTLAGREAVWTDPLSTGGYLLPTAFLSLLGQAGALGGERFMGTYRSALEEVLE